MEHPDHIGDRELQYHLLQYVKDGYKVQFSDFLPDFGAYIRLNRSQSPSIYWRRRIITMLFEIRNQGWIHIYGLDRSDEDDQMTFLETGEDFLFEITEDGYKALESDILLPKQPPHVREERDKKRKQRYNWVIRTPIYRLIYEYDYSRPKNHKTAKERIAQAIAIRRGQQEFRQNLLHLYKKCLITNCDAEDALEAAHIRPYSAGGTFELSNGLLLRADIHTLFDLNLIAIDTNTMTVILSPVLMKAEAYKHLDGKIIQFPDETDEKPSRAALDEHRRKLRAI